MQCPLSQHGICKFHHHRQATGQRICYSLELYNVSMSPDSCKDVCVRCPIEVHSRIIAIPRFSSTTPPHRCQVWVLARVPVKDGRIIAWSLVPNLRHVVEVREVKLGSGLEGQSWQVTRCGTNSRLEAMTIILTALRFSISIVEVSGKQQQDYTL